MTEQTAGLQVKVEHTGINATKIELDKLATSGESAERATDGLRNAVKKIPKEGVAANDSMKRMRNISQSLGYQLQDVAVQAQMGTSAFTILGQQGSQFASVFGPAGAVFGAALAIGSALVGAAFKAGDTQKELKDLEENALQLGDAFTISSNGTLAYNARLQRLAETAPEVARAIFDIKKAQLELEQTLTEGALKKSLNLFENIAPELDRASASSRSFGGHQKKIMGDLTKEFGGTSIQVRAVTSALADFNNKGSKDTAANLVESLSKLKGGSTEARKEIVKATTQLAQYILTAEQIEKSSASEAMKKQTKSVLSMVDSLKLEAETLGKTNRERDLYIAKQGEATAAQYNAINAAYDQIEADQSASVIEKLQQRLMSEEEKIDESYLRRREIITANTIEGSEQQNELLRENWDAYEGEYDEFHNRLYAKEEAAAYKREKLEIRVSKSIIRQKQGVVNSGVALLKNLTDGNEKAAKAIVVVEAGLNIARTIQNTAAASVRALAELGPIAGPPAVAEIQAYGAIQAGIIAANGVLTLSGSGGGGGSGVSISSGSGSNPYESSQLSEPTQTEDTRQPVEIHFHGDVNGLDPEHIAETLKEFISETDFIFTEVD